MRGADLAEQPLIEPGGLHDRLLLADLRSEVALQLAELLDLRVRDVQGIEDLRLGNLVRARLDHQDRVFGARHDEVEIGTLE